LAGYAPGRAFAPTVIVFIPRSGDECNSQQEHSEWLPRECPRCRQMAVVGHGRRQRPAYDRKHDKIRVRRGQCQRCDVTLTVLPAWCIPRAPYSLMARQESVARVAEGAPIEEAAPECVDPDRSADPTTVYRWCWRRLESLILLLCQAPAILFRAPTLLAWDWRAVVRILSPEPNPP